MSAGQWARSAACALPFPTERSTAEKPFRSNLCHYYCPQEVEETLLRPQRRHAVLSATNYWSPSLGHERQAAPRRCSLDRSQRFRASSGSPSQLCQVFLSPSKVVPYGVAKALLASSIFVELLAPPNPSNPLSHRHYAKISASTVNPLLKLSAQHLFELWVHVPL